MNGSVVEIIDIPVDLMTEEEVMTMIDFKRTAIMQILKTYKVPQSAINAMVEMSNDVEKLSARYHELVGE